MSQKGVLVREGSLKNQELVKVQNHLVQKQSYTCKAF